MYVYIFIRMNACTCARVKKIINAWIHIRIGIYTSYCVLEGPFLRGDTQRERDTHTYINTGTHTDT